MLIGETKCDGFFLLLLDGLLWVTLDLGGVAALGFGGVAAFESALLLFVLAGAFLVTAASAFGGLFNVLVEGFVFVKSKEFGGIGLTCAVGNLRPVVPLENGMLRSDCWGC